MELLAYILNFLIVIQM